MSKTQRQIRNFILKTNTWLASMLLILSACMIDSESIMPTVFFCISLAWLALFCYANKERIERMVAND